MIAWDRVGDDGPRRTLDRIEERVGAFKAPEMLGADRRTARPGRRSRERYEGHWRQTLQQGALEGVLVPLPPLLVKGVLGMVNYTYLWFEPSGPISPDELADEFLDALLRGIRRVRP